MDEGVSTHSNGLPPRSRLTQTVGYHQIFHQEHAAWLCMSFDFLKKDMKDEANKDNGYFKTTNQKETPLDISSTSTTTILET